MAPARQYGVFFLCRTRFSLGGLVCPCSPHAFLVVCLVHLNSSQHAMQDHTTDVLTESRCAKSIVNAIEPNYTPRNLTPWDLGKLVSLDHICKWTAWNPNCAPSCSHTRSCSEIRPQDLAHNKDIHLHTFRTCEWLSATPRFEMPHAEIDAVHPSNCLTLHKETMSDTELD